MRPPPSPTHQLTNSPTHQLTLPPSIPCLLRHRDDRRPAFASVAVAALAHDDAMHAAGDAQLEDYDDQALPVHLLRKVINQSSGARGRVRAVERAQIDRETLEQVLYAIQANYSLHLQDMEAKHAAKQGVGSFYYEGGSTATATNNSSNDTTVDGQQQASLSATGRKMPAGTAAGMGCLSHAPPLPSPSEHAAALFSHNSSAAYLLSDNVIDATNMESHHALQPHTHTHTHTVLGEGRKARRRTTEWCSTGPANSSPAVGPLRPRCHSLGCARTPRTAPPVASWWR